MRRSADVSDDPADDLVVVDLAEPPRTDGWSVSAFDRRAFEDSYAVLAFGLGVVPRRRHADTPPWRRLPVLVGAVTALMVLSSLGR